MPGMLGQTHLRWTLAGKNEECLGAIIFKAMRLLLGQIDQRTGDEIAGIGAVRMSANSDVCCVQLAFEIWSVPWNFRQ